MACNDTIGLKMQTLPMLPISDTVVLPYSVNNICISDPTSIELLENHPDEDNLVAIALIETESEETELDDFASVAVAARVLSKVSMGDGSLQILVRGENRIQLESIISHDPWPLAEVYDLDQQHPIDDDRGQVLVDKVLQLLDTLITADEALPQELIQILQQNSNDFIRFPDIIAAALDFDLIGRKRLLLAVHPEERLSVTSELLAEKVEAAIHQTHLTQDTRERIDKSRRDAWLRQQMAVIQEQLGDSEEEELAVYQERLQVCPLPEEARAEAVKELRRLRRLPPTSAEAGVARSWMDFILNLPWEATSASPPPYEEVHDILGKHHHGLRRVKERIAEEIAVMRMSGPGRGAILCFSGPPGTGKTSLGKAIAEALGRPYYRIALGGMRDESEIRGHRRTYVGSMPGRILEGLRRVKAKDPVFLIDEVDKLGVGYQGDPAAALLEVLDPEQNSAFTDHYLGVPFDLSNVVFVATANVAESIPPALRDRMEVIPLPGYTEDEKVSITSKFLLPQSLEASGLPPKTARVSTPAMRRIIRHYTREAGVRNLRRCTEKIARQVAVKRMEDESAVLKVGVKELTDILGTPKYRRGENRPQEGVGLATGLAWTPSGGELLSVEAMVLPGHGKEVLTGYLGQVMRESVHAALTLVRVRCKRLGIRREVLKHGDIHIHFPAGAIPKDGPSAGAAVAIAAASAMSGRAPAHGFAMTGEVSLRGRVLPIGGLREKLLAAARHGVKDVILPRGNEIDLEKVPEKTIENLNIHLVKTIEEVFELLFPRKKTAKTARSAKKTKGKSVAKKTAPQSTPGKTTRKKKAVKKTASRKTR